MEVVVTRQQQQKQHQQQQQQQQQDDDALHWSRGFKGFPYSCYFVLIHDFEASYDLIKRFLLLLLSLSWCVVMEENLCRDNHRDQPSCRELEIHSCWFNFSGFLSLLHLHVFF